MALIIVLLTFFFVVVRPLKKKKKKNRGDHRRHRQLLPVFHFVLVCLHYSDYLRRRGGEIDRLMGRPRRPPRPPRSENGLLLRLRGDLLLLIFLSGLRD